MGKQQAPTGFKDLLNSMMKRRWYISAIVLGGFMIIMASIFGAIMGKTVMSTEWKELLLLLLGAFIGSYGKIIDYWFSDTDKDKMLVQKMDEEDGVSLSTVAPGGDGGKGSAPIVPEVTDVPQVTVFEESPIIEETSIFEETSVVEEEEVSPIIEETSVVEEEESDIKKK
jgi:hypothetical protein